MKSSLGQPRIAPSTWILLTALAVIGTFACASSLMTGLRALWWVEAKAVMTRFNIAPDAEGRETLTVRYDYTFDGQTHTGSRFSIYDAPQEKWAEDYQAGREVTVFINPHNPSEAMLRRTMALHHWLWPGLLAVVAVGLARGAQKALVQQRIADDATLYTLESALTHRPSLRRRRRRRAA